MRCARRTENFHEYLIIPFRKEHEDKKAKIFIRLRIGDRSHFAFVRFIAYSCSLRYVTQLSRETRIARIIIAVAASFAKTLPLQSARAILSIHAE